MVAPWQVRPNAPAPGTFLMTWEELTAPADNPVRLLSFGKGRMAFCMILLVTADSPRAYVNLCPHYTMPLDAGTGLFLSADGDIQCRQHFALFDPVDGRCFAGACPGASLDAIPLQVDGQGNIHIAD